MTSKSAFGICVIALALVAPACVTPSSREVAFRVGNTTVHAVVEQHGQAVPTMINVHDDENTSVLAGRQVLRETGGRLIELAHRGHRLVEFQLDGLTCRFDPNRIFSDVGIRESLSRRGAYSEAAHAVVSQFARDWLDRFQLDHEPVIIALHNTDGSGLTIQSYLGTNRLSSASAEVYLSPQRAAGDFFYVTDARFFEFLKARDFNVTLQDDANVPDDGSLSVYFARRGIPYLNVEADNRHLAEQTEMVRVARRMLDELGLTVAAPLR